ncbi:MAG: very short patch repair endonuclease [Armatimonadetes bacterium]|nr:very short patch repair endonuclease [Armatimonadota bacterium]
MDIFDKETRSRIMSTVKRADTKPEMVVRSIIYRLGLRYRLHRHDLPGCPDIVLPKYKAIIFVNGCFWHGHEGCSKAKKPQTNSAFWDAKLSSNVARDINIINELQHMGWRVIIVWECETRNQERLQLRLATEFEKGKDTGHAAAKPPNKSQ